VTLFSESCAVVLSSRRVLAGCGGVVVVALSSACGGDTETKAPFVDAHENVDVVTSVDAHANVDVVTSADASENVDVVTGPLPPSCAPRGRGMTTCGQPEESCCISLPVPGGTFYRTYDVNFERPSDAGWPDESDPATVSAFRLDKYLVTIGRFRQFVAAWSGGWTPAVGSGKHTHLNGGRGLANSGAPGTYEAGWLTTDNANVAPTDANLTSVAATWTSVIGANEMLPINSANSFEAAAFCIWDGGFLPSEAEWEFAAAGGDEQRWFPWGSTAPGTSNKYDVYGCYYDPSDVCGNLANIAPIGSAPLGAGRFGQLDLAGDIREWTMDSFAAYVDPCTDCTYLTTSISRVIRGGSFLESARQTTPPVRAADFATRHGEGFRCARTP